MTAEERSCQSCRAKFTVEPEDFDFYKKISVPPPTWCPQCRMVRRMAWRNVRNLYKRSCEAPGHDEHVISFYSPEKPFRVYDQAYWWSDDWDPLRSGREYDFSVPFFVQFMRLFREAPLPNLSNTNPVGSQYVNTTMDSKNCYLVFSAVRNENCMYSEGISNCRECADLLASRNNERSYECIECRNCFGVSFSMKAVACSDSSFLYDCRNCTDCFGCWNLRNKQYCIFNEQYDKERYEKELKRLGIGSYAKLEGIKKIYAEKVQQAIHRFADIVHSENVTGNGIESSRNCKESFDIHGVADSKYVWRLLEDGGSDNYDISIGTKPALSYEGCGIAAAYSSKFGVAAVDTSDSQYVYSCFNGSTNLFGCVGLNKRHYCILNKQYGKEEYEDMVPRVIKHMNDMPYVDRQGLSYRYGEFFPAELSPFAYNETVAQEYFPLIKEEALLKGYLWRDPDPRDYAITKRPGDLPDHIDDVDESMLQETISCLHSGRCNDQCTQAFRVIKEELSLYKILGLPLPRLCSNCRHYERLRQRTPLKLWRNRCACDNKVLENATVHEHHPSGRCPNEFETAYAPGRPETVYCEQCYQAEVV